MQIVHASGSSIGFRDDNDSSFFAFILPKKDRDKVREINVIIDRNSDNGVEERNNLTTAQALKEFTKFGGRLEEKCQFVEFLNRNIRESNPSEEIEKRVKAEIDLQIAKFTAERNKKTKN